VAHRERVGRARGRRNEAEWEREKRQESGGSDNRAKSNREGGKEATTHSGSEGENEGE